MSVFILFIHELFLFILFNVVSVLGLVCILALFQQPFVHSVLQLLCPVVGAVLALHAEVDVGANAAVVQRLHWANIVAHAEEYLRGLILT